jgi:hypothetical protein
MIFVCQSVKGMTTMLDRTEKLGICCYKVPTLPIKAVQIFKIDANWKWLAERHWKVIYNIWKCNNNF